MGYDWVSFTTDYGLDDGFVAACKGVIGQIAPGVRVVDVTHTVPPHDVRRAAAVLAQTVSYLPRAVHLAVVDPGVGTARRGVAVVAGHGVLVGPDNGLLLPPADALGGAVAAYELTEPRYWLSTVSRTFHGRDVFAPVAAHVALGVSPESLGTPVDVASLVQFPMPRTRVEEGWLETEVVAVDRFGNVQLAATAADLALLDPNAVKGSRVQLRVGTVAVEAVLGATFGDVPHGELVVYLDSAGLVSVAVNGGSAAAWLGVTPGGDVALRRCGTPPAE
jgi:S-adenosylmethionine hydrolase